MQKNKFQLILGSKSPRRQELLKSTFINFQIRTGNIEEVSEKTEVHELVVDLASQKAVDVFENLDGEFQNPVVLGSDTIVVIDGDVLGKPKSREEAKEMLSRLSGRSHQVLTGVSLVSKEKELRFYDQTEVYFSTITDDLMEKYLDTEESMDKAGAYGIQAFALAFIDKVEGSYSNVVGLPVNLVLENLKTFVDMEGDSSGQWRECFE